MAASKDEDIQVTSRQWGVYTQVEYEAPGCKHSIGSIKCTMQKLTLLSELGPRKYSTFSKQQGVFFVQTHDFAIFTGCLFLVINNLLYLQGVVLYQIGNFATS